MGQLTDEGAIPSFQSLLITLEEMDAIIGPWILMYLMVSVRFAEERKSDVKNAILRCTSHASNFIILDDYYFVHFLCLHIVGLMYTWEVNIEA